MIISHYLCNFLSIHNCRSLCGPPLLDSGLKITQNVSFLQLFYKMNRFEFYQIFPERNLNFAEFCNKKKRFFGFGVGFLAVSDKFAEFTNFTKFTKIAEFTYFTKFNKMRHFFSNFQTLCILKANF